MIALKGELLVDGYGNFGVCLFDIERRPAILTRKILVSHPDYMPGYTCDITTRAWYRYDDVKKTFQNIYTSDVIKDPEVI